MSNTDPTNNRGINPSDREGLTVPASYNTFVVLPINIAKSGKYFREKEKIHCQLRY